MMWNAIKSNELHKTFSLFLGERRNVETFFIFFFTPLCPKWKAVDTVVSIISSEWKTTYATFLPALAASKTKSQGLHMLVLSCVRLFVTPWTIARQAPLFMGILHGWMDGHALLQGIFLTQELNWRLLHYSWIFYQESYQGSPKSYIRLHKKRMCTLYYSSLPSSEKAMAPHSSTLAWKIPWMEEPGRLQSMGSLRVGLDWATLLFTFHFHALEKEMATHSSVLAWRIPGRREPGASMGSHRVGHDWSDLAAAAAVSHPGLPRWR